MVDIPLDRLLEIAYADLHKNQAEFARVAKEVDPTKTPQQVLAELATIHPAPDKLLNAFHDTFDSLIAFIRAHHIITIPSDVQPTLEETPPFMRATTQASMDPPGPFETHSTKAYFNVTLPEKDWTPEHVAEHMAASTSAPSSPPACMRPTPATTSSSSGSRSSPRRSASSSAPTPTSKAGPTTASR
jgi:hypothetical protein